MVDPVKPRVLVLKGLRIRDDLLAVWTNSANVIEHFCLLLVVERVETNSTSSAPVSRQWRLL